MVCNNGTCQATSDLATDGQASEDGDLCTEGTTCSAGSCIGGTVKDCSGSGSGACIVGVCVPLTGECDADVADAVVRRAGIELDGARQQVRHQGTPVDLTAKEYALLRWFMLHPGEIHSAERLLEHVWDEHADPFTNTVRVTVGTLRRKLSENDEPQAIETVIGSGYRLLAPEEPTE